MLMLWVGSYSEIAQFPPTHPNRKHYIFVQNQSSAFVNQLYRPPVRSSWDVPSVNTSADAIQSSLASKYSLKSALMDLPDPS